MLCVVVFSVFSFQFNARHARLLQRGELRKAAKWIFVVFTLFVIAASASELEGQHGLVGHGQLQRRRVDAGHDQCADSGRRPPAGQDNVAEGVGGGRRDLGAGQLRAAGPLQQLRGGRE